MPLEPVSVALKFAFLAVLYLFLLWVVRSVLRDLRDSRPGRAPSFDDATGLHSATAGLHAPVDSGPRLHVRVERATGLAPGTALEVAEQVVLGRGPGADIRLDDDYASARHARIVRDGHSLVLEDLGSTNGTFLNDAPLHGPQPLHRGDRIRIGEAEFSVG